MTEKEYFKNLIHEHVENCRIGTVVKNHGMTLGELTNEKGTGMVDIMWRIFSRFEKWLLMGFLALLGAAILNFVSARELLSKAQIINLESKTDETEISNALKNIQTEINLLRKRTNSRSRGEGE